jgi:hypothetical protein
VDSAVAPAFVPVTAPKLLSALPRSIALATPSFEGGVADAGAANEKTATNAAATAARNRNLLRRPLLKDPLLYERPPSPADTHILASRAHGRNRSLSLRVP